MFGNYINYFDENFVPDFSDKKYLLYDNLNHHRQYICNIFQSEFNNIDCKRVKRRLQNYAIF
jgi:hypothetical protein